MKMEKIIEMIKKNSTQEKTVLGIECKPQDVIKVNGFKPFANTIVIDDILDCLLFYLDNDLSGSIRFAEVEKIEWGE